MARHSVRLYFYFCRECRWLAEEENMWTLFTNAYLKINTDFFASIHTFPIVNQSYHSIQFPFRLVFKDFYWKSNSQLSH